MRGLYFLVTMTAVRKSEGDTEERLLLWGAISDSNTPRRCLEAQMNPCRNIDPLARERHSCAARKAKKRRRRRVKKIAEEVWKDKISAKLCWVASPLEKKMNREPHPALQMKAIAADTL